ncbi:alpha/beta fold hydrolase [Mycobacterium timonense]|uniref:Alpha/beta hydrolase n=1 Tax=Mycobacterium timonense TaxID=701043 RepID=A0A7I9Z2Z1_9MYCO|nr:alpha/beta hydrolase [Mycobacterium timonense]GFG95215.1 alpha/beta hydrolase [Mycobacterium timonense]
MNYRTGAVQSADGTSVRHRVIGDQGPPIVLVHGGLQAAQNFQRLAEHLSRRFTVYVPDRRGRRPALPAGEGYGLAREGQDLEALIRTVGARHLFGLSSGATIALYTALEYPGIEKVALYEPPLTIDGADPAWWVPRYARALAAGKPALALAEIVKGTGGQEYWTRLPRFVLVSLLRVAIEIEARTVSGDDIAIKDLIPTMRLDSTVQRESITLVNSRISELGSEVLLIGGEKSAGALRCGLDSIAQRLPDAQRVELKGVGHIAADNRGAPETVARRLDQFFTTEA